MRTAFSCSSVRGYFVIARSQRVRPKVAGPMTGSATKQSSPAPRSWIASLTPATTSKNILAARRRPSFATTKPVQTLSRLRKKKRGERSAERRIQPMSAAQTCVRKRAACLRSGRRRAAENVACATPLLVGRARLPAHRCGSRQGFDLLTQLQAMLPGLPAQGALPAGSQAQCRDSTSRRGRNTAGRDAQSRPAPGLNRSQVDCDFSVSYMGRICLIRRGNTIGSMTSARIRAKTSPYSSRKISFSRSLDGPATFLGTV